jgi:O-antigen/teichoic acid export membrane protein
MKYSKLAQSAAKGALWNYLTFASGKGLVFITTIILARLLPPEDFGLMALALIAVNYLSKLNDFGIGSAMIYRQEDTEQTANVAFCLSLIMGSALTVAVFVSAPLIAAFFNEPRLTPIARVISVIFLISGIGSIHDVRLRKELDFRRRMIPEISQRFVKGGVSIGLALAGFGVWSLVWGQVSGIIAAALLFWLIYPWRPKLRFDIKIARMLITYGVQIGLFQILHVIYKNIDYLIIGRRMDTIQLGFYTMAFQLPHLVIYSIQMVVGQAVFPAYAKLQNDRNALGQAFLTTLKYVSLFCVPVALGIFVTAPEFVEVFYTKRWLPAVPVMQILAVYSMLNALSANADQVYNASGKPGIANKIGIIKMMLAVPVLWIAAGYNNILYVGIGQLVIAFMAAILQFIVASRMITVRPSSLIAALQPSAVGAAAMVPGLFILRSQISSFAPGIRLMLMVICGAALYIFAVWLTHRDVFRQTLTIFKKQKAANIES